MPAVSCFSAGTALCTTELLSPSKSLTYRRKPCCSQTSSSFEPSSYLAFVHGEGALVGVHVPRDDHVHGVFIQYIFEVVLKVVRQSADPLGRVVGLVEGHNEPPAQARSF